MSMSTRPILFRQTNMDTHSSPDPSFNIGDLVLCRYATYPYWPARIDRTHQLQYENQHKIQRRTKKGVMVWSYWCVFINDNSGGWVKLDRIIQYHIHLSSQIRLSPQHRWYEDQKKALDAADMIFKHSNHRFIYSKHLPIATPDINYYLANKNIFLIDDDDLEIDLESRKETTIISVHQITEAVQQYEPNVISVNHDVKSVQQNVPHGQQHTEQIIIDSCSEDDIPLIQFLPEARRWKRQRAEGALNSDQITNKKEDNDVLSTTKKQKIEFEKSQETISKLRQELESLNNDEMMKLKDMKQLISSEQLANKQLKEQITNLKTSLDQQLIQIQKHMEEKSKIEKQKALDCQQLQSAKIFLDNVKLQFGTSALLRVASLGKCPEKLKQYLQGGVDSASNKTIPKKTTPSNYTKENKKACENATNVNVSVEKKTTSQPTPEVRSIKKFASPFQPTRSKKRSLFTTYNKNVKTADTVEKKNDTNTETSCKTDVDKVDETVSKVEAKESVKTKPDSTTAGKDVEAEGGCAKAEEIAVTGKHHFGGIATAAALFKIAEKIKEHVEAVSSSEYKFEDIKVDYDTGEVQIKHKLPLGSVKEQENLDRNSNCTPNVSLHFANTTFNLNF